MVIPKGFSDFLASEVIEHRKDFSRFHVIPVPMEKSVSYGSGTAQGPLAILEASQQLEPWDGLSTPMDEGIHTKEAVDCFDPTEIILEKIEASVTDSLTSRAVPILLGGEHTVTLGALRAIHRHFGNGGHLNPIETPDNGNSQIDDDNPCKRSWPDAIPSPPKHENDKRYFHGKPSWPDTISATPDYGNNEGDFHGKTHRKYAMEKASFGIVQIDAHADLRDEYDGDAFSHACVMRRAIELFQSPLLQIGVRAMGLDEVEFRTRMGHQIIAYDARYLHEKGLEKLPVPLLPDDFPQKIYISIDLDGLDPSVIRATGTPVPGGIGWYDTLTLLERSIAGREVIGFDVVELAPIAGDHASDFAAAQLTYAVMGMIQRLC